MTRQFGDVVNLTGLEGCFVIFFGGRRRGPKDIPSFRADEQETDDGKASTREEQGDLRQDSRILTCGFSRAVRKCCFRGLLEPGADVDVRLGWI